MTKKPKFDKQSVLDAQVESIDEQIDDIDRRLKPFAEMIETKNQLVQARRVLLGAVRTGGGGHTNRLSLEELLDHIEKNPGLTATEIAEALNVSTTTVTSHVYRNKKRFVKKDGRLYKRDPEAGVDTEDDIEEDE